MWVDHVRLITKSLPFSCIHMLCQMTLHVFPHFFNLVGFDQQCKFWVGASRTHACFILSFGTLLSIDCTSLPEDERHLRITLYNPGQQPASHQCGRRATLHEPAPDDLPVGHTSKSSLISIHPRLVKISRTACVLPGVQDTLPPNMHFDILSILSWRNFRNGKAWRTLWPSPEANS